MATRDHKVSSIQGYWADQTAAGFTDLPADLIAVLPIGAIEQHGPHLPLSVDRDLVEAVIARAMPRLGSQQNVLVLPTLAVTKSGEHDRHAGTLSLSAQSLLANLQEIGAAVSRAGVARLVLLNGHGGNNAVLDIAARDLRISHQMLAATCSWFGFADYPDTAELAHDIHGGYLETSAMLAARPELVDMSKAQNFHSASADWAREFKFIGLTGQAAKPGWIIDDLNPHGACGNAAAATAEMGRQLLHSAAENFVAFLAEFARFELRKD